MLVQVIQQQTDFAAVAMIVAFALGAGAPMLVIALLGRKAMARAGFLTRHSEAIRKGMGAIILLWVALLASGIDLTAPGSKSDVAFSTGIEQPLAAPYKAPELTGIAGWINSKPLGLAALKGKVVLIDFWTYSCINCVRTLPYLVDWDKKYRDKGLVIIGISAPEFEFEKSRDNVADAAKKRGIDYPIALDNNLATWSAYHNQYWPAHYLIDPKGNVVYTHFGEGDYDVTEHNIRVLLGLKGEAADTAQMPSMWSSHQTPETYLGYARAERAKADLVHDKATDYCFPDMLPADSWSLNGKWQVGRAIHCRDAGRRRHPPQFPRAPRLPRARHEDGKTDPGVAHAQRQAARRQCREGRRQRHPHRRPPYALRAGRSGAGERRRARHHGEQAGPRGLRLYLRRLAIRRPSAAALPRGWDGACVFGVLSSSTSGMASMTTIIISLKSSR